MDFHTHNPHAPAGQAIINLPLALTRCPARFSPRPGCLYSAGIHPWWTAQPDAATDLMDGVAQLLAHPQVVALGECGLDALRGAPDAVQEELLCRQIALAEGAGKPVTLHVVRRFDRLLALHKRLRPTTQWTVHGFRGKPALARQLLDAGIDLSFGPRHNAEAYALTPPARRHRESDAPNPDE